MSARSAPGARVSRFAEFLLRDGGAHLATYLGKYFLQFAVAARRSAASP